MKISLFLVLATSIVVSRCASLLETPEDFEERKNYQPDQLRWDSEEQNTLFEDEVEKSDSLAGRAVKGVVGGVVGGVKAGIKATKQGKGVKGAVKAGVKGAAKGAIKGVIKGDDLKDIPSRSLAQIAKGAARRAARRTGRRTARKELKGSVTDEDIEDYIGKVIVALADEDQLENEDNLKSAAVHGVVGGLKGGIRGVKSGYKKGGFKGAVKEGAKGAIKGAWRGVKKGLKGDDGEEMNYAEEEQENVEDFFKKIVGLLGDEELEDTFEL